jgi:hypothetical protein
MSSHERFMDRLDMVVAFLSIACGLILDTVTRGRRELKLLTYLALRAPGDERRWS